MGKQNCGGDVADDLTGKNADEKRILFQKAGKQAADCGNSCHVSCKNKKANKGEEQRIVNLLQRVSVGKHQYQWNYDQADPIGNDAKNDDNRERKKHKIQSRAFSLQLVGTFLGDEKCFARKKKTTNRNQCDRCQKGQEHNAHKLTRWNVEFGIEIKILRISKGSQHAAEIGGNILHDKDECHVSVVSRGGKDKKAKRQKRQQRHIVCNQHRADKGDINQSKRCHAEISRTIYNLSGKDRKKLDVLQGTHHGKHAKQTGQRFKIKITRILRVGWDNAGGNDCRHKCDAKHCVFTDPKCKKL